MKRCVFVLCLSVAAATTARAQAPAARVGDPTSHGGQVAGPGVPTVLIGGRPAAVLGDWTTCPLSSGTSPNEVPHVGGQVVSGSATVLIGGKRAARAGDSNAENQASATIQTGATNVIIGP
jgi:uncharacterized Zn-binding protein involved in type VI secretion